MYIETVWRERTLGMDVSRLFLTIVVYYGPISDLITARWQC